MQTLWQDLGGLMEGDVRWITIIVFIYYLLAKLPISECLTESQIQISILICVKHK